MLECWRGVTATSSLGGVRAAAILERIVNGERFAMQTLLLSRFHRFKGAIGRANSFFIATKLAEEVTVPI
jgi:hypothetical protein